MILDQVAIADLTDISSLFAIGIRIGNDLPVGEVYSPGLWDQQDSWAKRLPNCRFVGPMADRYISMADLVSVDAIRRKARFLLDTLLVDLGCWSPVPEIGNQPSSQATGQGQQFSSVRAPHSPLILISHGLAGVVLKEVSWVPFDLTIYPECYSILVDLY